MALLINDKIRNLTPYQPIAGNFSVRLDANESFVQPDAAIQDEIREALMQVDMRRYPDPYATKLCECFAALYRTQPDYVTAGNGLDEILSLLIQAFLQKGEKLLCFTPDFSMYQFYTTLSECVPVALEKTANFCVDLDAARTVAKQESVRMVVFSNPCNPTAIGMKRADVLALVKATDALVVVDEAYMDFYDESVLDCVTQYDNLIVLRTCSKAIGLAGARIGFAVANERLTALIRAVKSPYNVNGLSQAVGEVVLSHADYLHRARKEILASRNMLRDGLQQIAADFSTQYQMIGADANFVFGRMQAAQDVSTFLQQQGIIIRTFGDYLRVTAGTLQENDAVLQAIRMFCEERGRM